MKKDKWIWMPHAAHFILGNYCRFHLATYVGGYVVSTVGELFPDEPVREIYAKSRGVTLEGAGDERDAYYLEKIGFEDIGFKRKYETMVFKAKPSRHKCCPFASVDGNDLDVEGYNDAGDAYEGHLRMCKKWARK